LHGHNVSVHKESLLIMAVLHFDKAQLGNLEYSLDREMLSTNRAGGYMSTTIICCNTRKYHGLMVCPVGGFDDEDYVLLSALDETIIQHDQEFHLAIHRYRGNWEPRGHKYITDFFYTPTPTITYRVGGVVLKKELLWVHSREQLLIRYTLVEAHSKTFLRLRPFLAFRSRHSLSKANMNADMHNYPIENGVKNRLYDGFPWLNLQTWPKAEYIGAPYWHYNFEYLREIERGYDSVEDLPTLGYFETEIQKGESIIFSASTEDVNPKELEALFSSELAKRTEKNEIIETLEHSSNQFLISYKGGSMLNAGYPWYNPRSRETFIALAGCTLTQGNVERFKDVLDHHVGRLYNGMFGHHLAADTQLWFFWALQRYAEVTSDEKTWNTYKDSIIEVLNTYYNGMTPYGCIHMNHETGLIYSMLPNKPLTWMNVCINGAPINQRPGYAVDVNALWYNAVAWSVNVASKVKDKEFLERWKEIPDLIARNFVNTFWMPERNYLADYVYEGAKNVDIRPNQIFAVSLDFSPLSTAQKGAVVDIVKAHLLTKRGLRTLSPHNPEYRGTYMGNQISRDRVLHNGTVFPWLLEHYVRASYKLRGKSFTIEAEDMIAAFEEDLLSYGVGSIPELYDGDPPHRPGGAISYAPSVGAILTIQQLINRNKK